VEHIVFDGGSSDGSVEILRKHSSELAYWHSEKDKGQTDAVNKGFRLATGEIIGWLNSDDLYYPGAFHLVAKCFDENPDVNFIYGMADHIDTADQVLEPYYTEDWSFDRLKQLCFICQPALFFRRAVLEKYGLLDESLNYCMDYEFWLRCGQHEEFYYLKRPLAGSRLYPENKTLGSKNAVISEIVSMLQEKFSVVDQQWLASRALSESHEKFKTRRRWMKSLMGPVYAWFLWQRYSWVYNKRVFPIVPSEFILRLPFLPTFLAKRLV